MNNQSSAQNTKQTLLSIKRTTTITTKAIAQKAQIKTADVFTVEIGGCASWAMAQKVVRAFNELSGMQVKVDDLKFSPLSALNSINVNASIPNENSTVGDKAYAHTERERRYSPPPV